MRVRLPNFLELVLEFIDKITLGRLDFFDGLLDSTKSPWINMRCLKYFVELQVLDLHVLVNGRQLLLKDEIVEAGLLVNGVDGVIKHLEEPILLFLFVLVAL